MKKDLDVLLENVCDEKTLIEYIMALSTDWKRNEEEEKRKPSRDYSPADGGWENGSIGSFLEAASSWAKSTQDGSEFYNLPDNHWKRFAEILRAGKHYE